MVKTIAIVGAGRMGRGMAQVCAQRGHDIILVDAKERPAGEEILDEAFDTIRGGLRFLSERGLIAEDEATSTMSRIKGSTNLEESVKNADFVMETVSEVLDLKKQIFSRMDGVCRKQAILSTNTSSMSISEIATATSRQDRVVGFHWMYPPYIVPVVEIVAGTKTSDLTLNTARDLVLRLGKTPIVCKDVPGFLVNRLQFSILGEAISLLEQGVATAQDIDNALRLTMGLRLPFWGLLRTADMTSSNKIMLAIFEYLYEGTGKDKFRPPSLLREKVRKGELGLEVGRGWYDYTKEAPGAVAQERDDILVKMLEFLSELGYFDVTSLK